MNVEIVQIQLKSALNNGLITAKELIENAIDVAQSVSLTNIFFKG